jgi:hypothetical protein
MSKFLTTITFSILLLNFATAQTYNWKTLKTGAGGWVTGSSIHPSGEPKYCRVDVGSAYRWEASTSTWVNIVTANNLPVADVYWNKYSGVLSLISAPSDANVAYLAYYNGIYRSTNKGTTWIKTTFPSTPMSPNIDDSKLSGERLSVDPTNANVVYFGSINNGLWRSFDGGTTWEQIMAVPSGVANRGVRSVFFDTNKGTTSGRTNRIYALVDGDGVYRSLDAGATWGKINTGTALNSVTDPIFLDAAIDNSGRLYVVGHGQAAYNSMGVWRYTGSAWERVYDTWRVFLNIAIDPFNNDRVFIFSNGGTETFRTTNVNATTPTWTELTHNRTSPNIGWMGWADTYWFSLGEIEFDPITPNKLWITEGVGVWNCTDLTDDNMTWVENSKAQEHLVSNDLAVNAAGKVVTAHWDRPLFAHNDLDAYPTQHQLSIRFNTTWDFDVCPADQQWLFHRRRTDVDEVCEPT